MARKSRFSFPLPGRRRSAEKEAAAALKARDDDLLAREPAFRPGGKLESMLGGQDAESNGEKNKKSRKLLVSKPSFLSVSVSEMSHESVDETSQDEPCLRPRASSPVLGKTPQSDSPELDVFTDVTGSRLHNSDSSSTLRSYYDPMKSPPSISQQTSASSARDMALRKGHRPILSPLSQDHSQDSNEKQCELVVGNNNSHIENPRQRSTQLNISTLFPKPRAVSGPLLSPHRITSSPSIMSLASDAHVPSSPSRRKWLGWKSNRSSSAPIQNADMAQGVLEEQNLSLAKLSHGVEAGYVQTERAVGFQRNHSHQEAESKYNQDHSQILENDDSYMIGRASSSNILSPSSPRSPNPQRPHFPHPHSSCFPWEVRSVGSLKSHRSQHSNRTTATLFFYSNLRKQSVLSLSSSEDESEEDTDSLARSQRLVRDSVDATDRGDKVVVARADVAKPVRSPSVLDVRTSPATPPRSRSMQHPKHPLTPELRHSPSSRSQNQRAISYIKEATPETVSTSSVQSKSATMEMSTITHSPSLKHRNSEMNRIMAVTREEEKLLEAMREKRASMRGTGVENGHNIASGLNRGSPLRRPKTADAKKRSSWFLDSDLSHFPPPPNSESSKFFRNLRSATSTDILPLEQSSRSIEISPIPKRSSSLHASKIPPALSLDSDGLLPSPATSRGLPLTPPSDRSSLEIHANGNVSLSEQSASSAYSTHLRKRTLSSGMVIYDGIDRCTPEQDELALWETTKYL